MGKMSEELCYLCILLRLTIAVMRIKYLDFSMNATNDDHGGHIIVHTSSKLRVYILLNEDMAECLMKHMLEWDMPCVLTL